METRINTENLQAELPRIRVLEKHVIYVKELENPDPDDILHSAQEVQRLGQDWEHYGIIVEFSNLVVPSTEVRHKVSQELANIRKKLVGVAVITKTNIFLKIGFKFIAQFAGFPNISFHSTRASAIKHLTTLNERRAGFRNRV
jgi:hypothetical protein